MENKILNISTSIILSIGIALGGFFPGYYYYNAKMHNNTVTVKGLAEREVISDLALWEIKFVTTSNNLAEAQKNIKAQEKNILLFLKRAGFNSAEISNGRLETNDLMANPYRNNEISNSRYIITQSINIRTTNVKKVEKAVTQTGELVEQGIIFDSQNSYPVTYMYTKLNEIKPEMLEEATKNARNAAKEFAKSSGSKVGKIHRANQGVFSISAQDENSIASQQINKKIRVVSTVEYYLD